MPTDRNHEAVTPPTPPSVIDRTQRHYYYLQHDEGTQHYILLHQSGALVDNWPGRDGVAMDFTQKDAWKHSCIQLNEFLGLGQLSQLQYRERDGTLGQERTFGRDPEETPG